MKNARSESESPHFKGENTLYPTNSWEKLQGSPIKGGQVCDPEPMIQELFDPRGATEFPGNHEDVASKRVIDDKVDYSCCVSGFNERRES